MKNHLEYLLVFSIVVFNVELLQLTAETRERATLDYCKKKQYQ